MRMQGHRFVSYISVYRSICSVSIVFGLVKERVDRRVPALFAVYGNGRLVHVQQSVAQRIAAVRVLGEDSGVVHSPRELDHRLERLPHQLA
jgi:hypothetical protein